MSDNETRWFFPRKPVGKAGSVVTLHVRYNSTGSSYCDPSNTDKLTTAFVSETTAKARKGLRLCGSCLRSINGKQ